MVQPLHFTTYDLSKNAWDDWFFPGGRPTRLGRELEHAFGPERDGFVDSGGFQVLQARLTDLSKWNLQLDRETVLRLQLQYNPTRVASFDHPIARHASGADAREAMRLSLRNATWLARQGSELLGAIPYLVVHGRNPDEIRGYLKGLSRSLGSPYLRKERFGVALGSQVPLVGDPTLVAANIGAVDRWLGETGTNATPLHVFGVGDGLVGRAVVENAIVRPVSYDNSTYVRAAMRQRYFNQRTLRFEHFAGVSKPECACGACSELARLGPKVVHAVLKRPSYNHLILRGSRITRSDILGLIAIHNLRWWKLRVRLMKTRVSHVASAPGPVPKRAVQGGSYWFPLASYRPRSPNLVFVQCSRTRPYRDSRTHRRAIEVLRGRGYREGRDYDRVTISGLHGPVHWRDEEQPAIAGYDFRLDRTADSRHVSEIQSRTASVLRVLRRRYRKMAALLPTPAYFRVFGPVFRSFDVVVARRFDDLSNAVA